MKKHFLTIGLPLLSCLAFASCGGCDYDSEYSITWQNYNGDVLEVSQVKRGQYPCYQGDEPTRPEDEQYSYTFSGWTPEVEFVYSDATYKATYDSKIREYSITWEDYDGAVLRVDSVAYGDTPSYGEDGEEPARERDAQYSYVFSEWEPSIVKVTGDATYRAVYSSTTNMYRVTWENYDGTTLKCESYNYGETPSYGAVPERDESAGPYDCYVFDGWYPEVREVTCDAIYRAEYRKEPCTDFTIRYDANGGTGWLPCSQKKKSGEPLVLITYNGKCEKEGYLLYGWNNLYDGKVYHHGDELTLDMNLTMYAMWAPICPICGGDGHAEKTVCPECEGEGYLCPYCNEPLIKRYENYSPYVYGYCSSCGKQVYKYGSNSYSSKVFFDEKVMCTNCKGKGYFGFDGDCDKYVFEDAPIVSERGARSITLQEKPNYEYSLDSGDYQSSNVFDGLLPHTTYTFRQRRATSGGVPFGIDSKELTVTTTDDSSYYVTYKLNGGQNDPRNPATYKKSVSSTSLYSPTKEGYVFAGWSYNGDIVTAIKGSWNVDITLEATWKKLNERQFGIVPFADLENGTLTYGLYPQTRVSDETLIKSLNTLTIAESNGWYLFNGNYYAKKSAAPYSPNYYTTYKYVFDDGTEIVKGTIYWFKCEPITWEILSSENGEYSLVSTLLLDAHRYNEYYSGTKNGCYANNYGNSEIREWLNDDFYNSAFSLGNSNILETTVDNSASTTFSSSNIHACADTTDKVYLLSYEDYYNSLRFFSSRPSIKCKTTDWARANGAFHVTSYSYLYNGMYWTRSPNNSSSYSVEDVDCYGSIDTSSVSNDSLAVRPAVTIKIA